jgi:hypothetical protein
LFDADFAEAGRDAVGAIGDLGMGATSLAGDDAEESGRFAHFLFFFVVVFVIPGRCEASNPESISQRTIEARWIPGLRLRRIPE